MYVSSSWFFLHGQGDFAESVAIILWKIFLVSKIVEISVVRFSPWSSSLAEDMPSLISSHFSLNFWEWFMEQFCMQSKIVWRQIVNLQLIRFDIRATRGAYFLYMSHCNHPVLIPTPATQFIHFIFLTWNVLTCLMKFKVSVFSLVLLEDKSNYGYLVFIQNPAS